MKRHGRPVLGGISGFFFGLFLAADLAQWSVRPLDNLGVIGLPILGAVLGVGLGLWAPIRRAARPARPAEPEEPAPPLEPEPT